LYRALPLVGDDVPYMEVTQSDTEYLGPWRETHRLRWETKRQRLFHRHFSIDASHRFVACSGMPIKLVTQQSKCNADDMFDQSV
jgi:hypothetical protein